MFEINLLPNVKGEIAQEEKNWGTITFVCGFVIASLAGILLILALIIGMQGTMLAGKGTELICRSSGETDNGESIDCSRYGTPVTKIEDLKGLMTVQRQINLTNKLTSQKLRSSRVVGAVEAFLVNNENVRTTYSKVDYDASKGQIKVEGDMQTNNETNYQGAETMKTQSKSIYFDYGNYMRKTEDGKFEKIPSFCVDEKITDGIVIGVYHKGMSGCEQAFMENATDDSGNQEMAAVATVVEDIEIKRTYKNKKEQDKAKEEGYYFDSKCLDVNSSGINERTAITKCGLISDDGLKINNSSDEKNANGNMNLHFAITVKLNKKVFDYSKKNMIVGRDGKFVLLDGEK